ncbi:MAG: hypothetical protein JW704_01330 [Anaerolineaceae bacterium]|nr:hypothetical protein [Anaerolineaceae bacterium]
MTSWEVIKELAMKGTREGTLGRSDSLNKAGRLFVSLQPYLNDYDEAAKILNADPEMGIAICQARFIEDLKKNGALS